MCCGWHLTHLPVVLWVNVSAHTVQQFHNSQVPTISCEPQRWIPLLVLHFYLGIPTTHKSTIRVIFLHFTYLKTQAVLHSHLYTKRLRHNVILYTVLNTYNPNMFIVDWHDMYIYCILISFISTAIISGNCMKWRKG